MSLTTRVPTSTRSLPWRTTLKISRAYSRPSKRPAAVGCSCRGASSRGARGLVPRDCPTSLPTDYPRPHRPGISVLLCPRRHRPWQVRHPQPVWPLRGTTIYRLSHQELAGRRHAELLQPRLRPGQYSRLVAGQSLRPVRKGDTTDGFSRTNPSGYAESQGAFTLRLAQEMRPRLGLPCPVELKKQVDFPEPRVRINTDPANADIVGWDESAAWDEMAQYYQRLGKGTGQAGL